METSETTPVATDDSGVYHVTAAIPGVGTHRYAVQAADADDATAYVRLVCLPVDYPGVACTIETAYRARRSYDAA